MTEYIHTDFVGTCLHVNEIVTDKPVFLYDPFPSLMLDTFGPPQCTALKATSHNVFSQNKMPGVRPLNRISRKLAQTTWICPRTQRLK